MFAENDMSGLFSAQAVAVLCHILIDILITNSCLFVVNAGFVACFVQTEVGHDGRYDRVIFQFALLF